VLLNFQKKRHARIVELQGQRSIQALGEKKKGSKLLDAKGDDRFLGHLVLVELTGLKLQLRAHEFIIHSGPFYVVFGHHTARVGL